MTYTWVLMALEERVALQLGSFVCELGREFFARPWETALHGVFESLTWEVDLERPPA
jgi:hypothetical protein